MAIRKYGAGEVLGEDKRETDEKRHEDGFDPEARIQTDQEWEQADEEPFPQTNP